MLLLGNSDINIFKDGIETEESISFQLFYMFKNNSYLWIQFPHNRYPIPMDQINPQKNLYIIDPLGRHFRCEGISVAVHFETLVDKCNEILNHFNSKGEVNENEERSSNT